jgi:hypothetical protein
VTGREDARSGSDTPKYLRVVLRGCEGSRNWPTGACRFDWTVIEVSSPAKSDESFRFGCDAFVSLCCCCLL